jgi:hypothetical protein
VARAQAQTAASDGDTTSAQSPASAGRAESSDTDTADRVTITLSVSVVVVAVVEASAPQPSSRPENLTAVLGSRDDGHQGPVLAAIPAAWVAFTSPPGLPGKGQSLLTARASDRAGHEGEAVLEASLPRSARDGIPSDGERAALPQTVNPDGERAEREAALPPPHRLAELAFLPPVPLAAVEAGMQQFLEQLERIGQCLATDQDEGRLWPWIAAGAAAAAACEIARRQLRRAEGAPGLARPRLPGPPAGPFFTG